MPPSSFRITPIRILQTALIIGVGDASAQAIEVKPSSANEFVERFDYKRNSQMIVFGIANNGIAVPFWLRTMWARLGAKRDLGTVGKKILADQVIYAPVVIGSVLLYTAVCKEMNGEQKPNGRDGDSMKRVKEDFEFNIRTKALEIYLYDCAVWPVASFLNYRILPERYMVTFYSVITVAWNCYLSWRSWDFTKNAAADLTDSAPSLPVVVATASAKDAALPIVKGPQQ